MARPSKSERTWSDAQLKDAVATSANWRNVMRALKDGWAVVVGRRPYSVRPAVA
jgi:hypothetical protein